MPESYYELLGVPGDASDHEIKEAYLLLARKLHPDICREAGAEERFKQVGEAYRVLSDHGERARYDALGHGNYLLYRAGPRDFPSSRVPPDFHGFGDAFDLFFAEKAWGSPRAFRPRGTSDILVRAEVTLGEAVLGGEKEIEVPHAIRCTACAGTGSTTGKAGPCPRCGGSGREGIAEPGRPSPPGSPPCRKCGGRGRIPEDPCGRCDGRGSLQETRLVKIRMPPGIGSGMRIRKEGLGDRVEDGIPKGDLYIEVTVLPHERFTRMGDDLEMPLHISPARAALGCTAEVMTLHGHSVPVEVPPGVQNDAALRVAGEGVKTGEGCGDLILRIRIDTPEGITAEEQDLYRRILRIEARRDGAKSGFIERYLSKIRGRGS